MTDGDFSGERNWDAGEPDWNAAENPERPTIPGESDLPADEAGPIGIFPSWGWLYGTVVAWCAVMILFLYWFTVTFDFGAR